MRPDKAQVEIERTIDRNRTHVLDCFTSDKSVQRGLFAPRPRPGRHDPAVVREFLLYPLPVFAKQTNLLEKLRKTATDAVVPRIDFARCLADVFISETVKIPLVGNKIRIVIVGVIVEFPDHRRRDPALLQIADKGGNTGIGNGVGISITSGVHGVPSRGPRNALGNTNRRGGVHSRQSGASRRQPVKVWRVHEIGARASQVVPSMLIG